MNDPHALASAQRSEFDPSTARRIVADLMQPQPWIFWADLLLSLTIAYSAATVFLVSPVFSWVQIPAYLIAGFALFRVSSFMHEIVHFRRGQMTSFQVAWNILAGIPMLMPSFLYQSHLVHHNTRHYGTGSDGEYLPLGNGPLRETFRFLSQVFFLPIMVVSRFLFVTPISFLHPRLRTWVLQRMSSFVINFSYRRTIPENAPLRSWAAIEIACSLRAWAIFVCAAVGLTPWTRIPMLYLLALMPLGLNHIRTLVAHRYTSDGDAMSHTEQLVDSVNVEGGWLTELIFPVGLRYHALHHLLPSIPYHNLGIAHRRLVNQLPADSVYHQVNVPSYFAAAASLIREQLGHSREHRRRMLAWYRNRRRANESVAADHGESGQRRRRPAA